MIVWRKLFLLKRESKKLENQKNYTKLLLEFSQARYNEKCLMVTPFFAYRAALKEYL